MTDGIQVALIIEQDRLKSIVDLVWSGGHYTHNCPCLQCKTTRLHLDPADLVFVNHISNATQPDRREVHA